MSAPRQALQGDDIQSAIAHINEYHAEELLYCVRAFTPWRAAERAEMRQLFHNGFEVECAGERQFIPFVPADSLKEAMRATSLEAMKRLGVWPPRRVAHWTVQKNERLGKNFRRLTLHLNGDDRSDWCPGDCCRFDVAPDETPRPYTLRKVIGGCVLVDIYCHAGSPGSQWAEQLLPQAQITARGERHELFPDFSVGEAWLLGDETALPTIAALLETWTNAHPVHVLLSVKDAGDRAYLDGVRLPAQARISWLEGDNALLTATTLPGYPAAIWAAAEVGVSLTLKKRLKQHFPDAEVRTIGYWRGAAD